MWPRLAAHLPAPRPDLRVLVKTARPVFLGGDGQREHVWLEARALDADGARVVPFDQGPHVPVSVDDAVAHGDVSDWIVQTAEGEYGPQDIVALERTVAPAPGGSP
jgi:hypothetical protein